MTPPKAPSPFCDLATIAEAVDLDLAVIQGYADQGWFDTDEASGLYCRGDSIYRCGLIHHLRTHWGYDDEEIGGALRLMDRTGIARMGGGRVRDRFVPFEQELAKAGPVWICVPQGPQPQGRPVRFVIHGAVDTIDYAYMVVRDDAILVEEGQAERFEIRGRAYARGATRCDLKPGRYRIHLGGCASYGFTVAADADETFSRLVLRYFRGTRCGEATEFYPACHRDDGIRSDTGAYYPLVGGWHDAGDFCHITSTTTASYYLARACETAGITAPHHDLLLEEALHGADYNLRARDPETGQVFENKGVGRGGLHGRYGDNHRLTDNRIGSGDERQIRVGGALQTALDCIAALGVAARLDPAVRDACLEGAERSYRFHLDQDCTSIFQIGKRVIACVELLAASGEAVWRERLDEPVQQLIAAVDSDGDILNLDGAVIHDHYQHGSPFLGLVLAAGADIPQAAAAREAAVRAANRMVATAALHPFGIACFSITKDEHQDRFTNQDTTNIWHPLGNGKSYRLYQPFTQKFWQGSVSHYSLLGIGLALLARLTGEDAYRSLAIREYEWAIGMNPYQCCLISGWGDCEAAPQSGMVGYMPGGTYQGPIGDQDDQPYFQIGRGMRIGEEPRFNYGGPSYAREYWSPLSGALLWLRELLR